MDLRSQDPIARSSRASFVGRVPARAGDAAVDMPSPAHFVPPSDAPARSHVLGRDGGAYVPGPTGGELGEGSPSAPVPIVGAVGRSSTSDREGEGTLGVEGPRGPTAPTPRRFQHLVVESIDGIYCYLCGETRPQGTCPQAVSQPQCESCNQSPAVVLFLGFQLCMTCLPEKGWRFA